MSEPYEIIGGMIATDSPQVEAGKLLALLDEGDMDGVRAYLEARARRARESVQAELDALVVAEPL